MGRALLRRAGCFLRRVGCLPRRPGRTGQINETIITYLGNLSIYNYKWFRCCGIEEGKVETRNVKVETGRAERVKSRPLFPVGPFGTPRNFIRDARSAQEPHTRCVERRANGPAGKVSSISTGFPKSVRLVLVQRVIPHAIGRRKTQS